MVHSRGVVIEECCVHTEGVLNEECFQLYFNMKSTALTKLLILVIFVVGASGK